MFYRRCLGGLAVIAGCVLGWSLASGHAAPAPKQGQLQWEYRMFQMDVDREKNEAEFNKLGEEGWECFTTSAYHPPANMRAPQLIAVFKRLKR